MDGAFYGGEITRYDDALVEFCFRLHPARGAHLHLMGLIERQKFKELFSKVFGSRTAQRKPLTPSSTTLRQPGVSVVTIGFAIAAASRRVRGVPSL